MDGFEGGRLVGGRSNRMGGGGNSRISRSKTGKAISSVQLSIDPVNEQELRLWEKPRKMDAGDRRREEKV